MPADSQKGLQGLSGAMKATRQDLGLRVRALGRRRNLVTDFYHQLLRFTWPQLMMMFAGGFLGLNLLFAWLYSLDPGGVSRTGEAVEGSLLWRDFVFSVHTVATIGYGNVYPVSLYTNILVVIEITLGIVFFALSTGIAFARFSRPTARVIFSEAAVVSKLQGVPTLMFRAANQRHNFIFEARATVALLVDEQVDGGTMRRFYDLDLVRSSSPVFTLTWTLMHRIEPGSPLADWLAGEKAPPDAEIVVILAGTDGLTGQTIYGRWAYACSDIRWNSRFADILGIGEDGVRTIDYKRFNDVVPGERAAH